ncbi:MAG: nitroreductase family protein [Geminicoccaceae bacterium]
MDRDPLETLITRRSVVAKNLGEPGPDDDALERILRVGMRVPDHGKLGPWRLQVLRKPAQRMLGDVLASAFAADHPDARDDQIDFERRRPARAPVLIAVSSRLHRQHKIPEIEQLLSCGAVCQNLLNAAVLSGFGAQWLTEWPAFDDRVKAALDVPVDQHIIGFVSIGTPVEPPNERPRPAFESVVSFHDTLPGPGAGSAAGSSNDQ